MEPLAPRPAAGRVFRSERGIGLSDRDPTGRLRLDAVARYLQDVATDDVRETGWGEPEHLWVVRHLRIDVVAPPLEDETVELATWSSGAAALAAGRRMSLVGDRGGNVELDSVWIHLGPEGRPARIGDFGPYAETAGSRVVSSRLELAAPATGATRLPWPLRATDLDTLGHVNNAAYWHAVEECLPLAGLDLTRPYRARLDHRHPLDSGELVELAVGAHDSRLDLAFMVGGVTRAAARVEALS
jgi:acyl-ACP thioesterase